MTEPERPEDPRDLRCGDADRQQVAGILHRAVEEGRLTIEELDQRLQVVYAARTYRDLEPVLGDLPIGGLPHGMLPRLVHPPGFPVGPVPVGPVPVGPVPHGAPLAAYRQPGVPGARIGGVPTSTSAVAIFGGAKREGVWVVGDGFTAFTMFGGVDIDLRDAFLATREVSVTAVAVFGGVTILVPDDVAVQVEGVGLFGGYEGPQEAGIAGPDVPLLRVTGLALFGGVEVKRKPKKRPKGIAG